MYDTESPPQLDQALFEYLEGRALFTLESEIASIHAHLLCRSGRFHPTVTSMMVLRIDPARQDMERVFVG